MHTSDYQLAKDAKKAAELALAGLIIAAQTAVLFAAIHYFVHA